MRKARRKNKKIKAAAAAFLILILAAVFILCFPLFGKKHTEIWAASDEFDISSVKTVEKAPNEEFKILQLTDLQLWAVISDNKEALDQVDSLIEKTSPDLIVLTGDNVSGITTNYLIRQVIDRLESHEIPWATVFGNHDAEGKATLNWQGDRFEEAEYCLFEKGPSNLYGVGNYVVNITENGKAVYSLFMMDNGRYCDYGGDTGKREIYMGYEQMAWYEWNVKGIAESEGHTVPSMVFTHFALPQTAEAIEELAVIEEIEIDGEPVRRYTVPEEYGFGSCAYIPGAAPVDSGFFDLCKELGSTKYFFFGHDHENDASITYEGMTMTYGLKTGPSPRPWNEAERYGGTLITIGNASDDYKVSIEHITQAQAE